VGESTVGMLSDQRLTELPIAAFETLIRENRAQVLSADRDPDADRAIRDCVSRASETDLRAATHRSGLIGQYLETGVLPVSTVVPERTFFRWLAHYRKAEAAYGSGFLGLLPQSSNRGNHRAKLAESSRRLMQECMPPAEPRFGSTCERLFGTANTQFIHNLRGNTQITRNGRQVTKAVNPKGLATWPLADLHRRLSEYFYEIHDTLAHPALGQCPRDAFRIGLASGGARVHRMVPYDDEFMMLTLPTTAKGTAKVMVSRGVKINHIYYWCDAFRQIEGEIVPVRYDPFDAGTAYVFVGKQWLQCHSECFATLKGRSEREIMLATTELHGRRRNHAASFNVTARHLAEFLESVKAEEILLTQRLRDRESLGIRLGIVAGAENTKAVVEQHAPARPTKDVGVDEVVGELYGEF